MAEFQEFMKQFNRMCWSYQRERKCPMACPMNGVNISQCRKIAFERSKETEKIVMQWAAEHPVVYPTWENWLTTLGVQSFNELTKPIPADIAQKLGIEPKEDI